MSNAAPWADSEPAGLVLLDFTLLLCFLAPIDRALGASFLQFSKRKRCQGQVVFPTAKFSRVTNPRDWSDDTKIVAPVPAKIFLTVF